MVHSLSDSFKQEVIQMANSDLTFGTHKIIQTKKSMKKRDFVILKTLVCRSVIVDLFINRKANGKE